MMKNENSKKTIIWLTAAVAVVVLLIALNAMVSSSPVTGTAFVMDTILEYKLYGKNAQSAGKAIEQALAGLESRMSLYQAGSEISRLNAQAGEMPVELSDDTYALMEACVEYARQSEGVFDVTVAPLALAWDVTAENPRVLTGDEISRLRPLVDYRDIILDPTQKTAMLARDGQMIDVGGIAKGYACDLARRTATENGVKKGYISIGGNLMVMGKKSMTKHFLFGVRDPRGGANDFLATISLPGMTMATSGDYERYFIEDGVRFHHIIDPATGAPARSDIMSVSVVAADGAYADFMSTYLFIKGKEFTLQNLNTFDCGLIVIDTDQNVYVSERLRKNFEMSDLTGSYKYEVA